MDTSRATILIVEDNALNLELATDLLAAEGYLISQAQSGEEGLRLAREAPPALILMDLRLPGIDGYAALRQLKEDPRTGHIPHRGANGPGDEGGRGGGAGGWV